MGNHHLTRRSMTGLLAAAPLALRSGAAWAAPDYAQELKVFLDTMQLPYKPATLHLRDFEVRKVQQRGVVIMRAVVELHWQPGMRRRKFSVEAGDADFAFIILAGGIESYFFSIANN